MYWILGVIVHEFLAKVAESRNVAIVKYWGKERECFLGYSQVINLNDCVREILFFADGIPQPEVVFVLRCE